MSELIKLYLFFFFFFGHAGLLPWVWELAADVDGLHLSRFDLSEAVQLILRRAPWQVWLPGETERAALSDWLRPSWRRDYWVRDACFGIKAHASSVPRPVWLNRPDGPQKRTAPTHLLSDESALRPNLAHLCLGPESESGSHYDRTAFLRADLLNASCETDHSPLQNWK